MTAAPQRPRRSPTRGRSRSVAVGVDGAVYVADLNNHRIRKIDHNGLIPTTVGHA